MYHDIINDAEVPVDRHEHGFEPVTQQTESPRVDLETQFAVVVHQADVTRVLGFEPHHVTFCQFF
jgi:hypothetical protein